MKIVCLVNNAQYGEARFEGLKNKVYKEELIDPKHHVVFMDLSDEEYKFLSRFLNNDIHNNIFKATGLSEKGWIEYFKKRLEKQKMKYDSKWERKHPGKMKFNEWLLKTQGMKMEEFVDKLEIIQRRLHSAFENYLNSEDEPETADIPEPKEEYPEEVEIKDKITLYHWTILFDNYPEENIDKIYEYLDNNHLDYTTYMSQGLFVYNLTRDQFDELTSYLYTLEENELVLDGNLVLDEIDPSKVNELIDVENYVVGKNGTWFAKPKNEKENFKRAYISIDQGDHWFPAYATAKREAPSGRTQVGKVNMAGVIKGKGYYMGRNVLTWYANQGIHEVDYSKEIDHKNGDFTDDRFENLRRVTPEENIRFRNEQMKHKYDSKIGDIIKKKPEGYIIYSEKGKRLSKAYKTKEEAEKRLKQIEMFKHMKKDSSYKGYGIEKKADLWEVWEYHNDGRPDEKVGGDFPSEEEAREWIEAQIQPKEEKLHRYDVYYIDRDSDMSFVENDVLAKSAEEAKKIVKKKLGRDCYGYPHDAIQKD